MCYSAKVKQAFRSAQRKFGGQLSFDDFLRLLRQRENVMSLRIPAGMEAQLIAVGGTFGREVELSRNRYRANLRKHVDAQLATEGQELLALEKKQAAKPTQTTAKAIGVKQRKIAKLQGQFEKASIEVSGDYRIYPFDFAPIVIEDGGQRLIVPARYRILPRTGVEVPPQYNVFNARRDSLQSARNWKPLFGKKHALFPFERFYEWVERDGKKVEVSFSPDGHEDMWAASLYEEYQDPEIGLIRSFAMVTDEPPAEVAAAGHDRCPVFLRHDLVGDWLSPEGKSLEQLDALLGEKEPTYYSHAVAA